MQMSNKEMQQMHLPLPTTNDKNKDTAFCAQMSNKERNGPHLMTTATLCLLVDIVATTTTLYKGASNLTQLYKCVQLKLA